MKFLAIFEKIAALHQQGDTVSRARLAKMLDISSHEAGNALSAFKHRQEIASFCGAPSRVIDTENKPVLVFSDTHAPYQHVKALEFLQDTYSAHGCGSVVCAGDFFDHHAMSRFVSETDSPSPEVEYQKALEWSDSVNKAFPTGVLVEGNHDAIPSRQIKLLGLAPGILKEKNELYGLSAGWKIEPLYHTIFNGAVLIEHGIGSGGMYGAINTAIAKRSSFCQGHTHSYAMVAYRSNYRDTIFGMNCGCLFDADSLAARYGQYAKWKGVLGCGIVYAPNHAEFIPLS